MILSMARPNQKAGVLRKRVDVTLNPEIVSKARLEAQRVGRSFSGLIEELLIQKIEGTQQKTAAMIENLKIKKPKSPYRKQ